MRPSFILLLVSLLSLSCQEIEQPKTLLTPDQIKRVKAEILKEAPTPKYEINAVFDEKIKLLGFDLSGDFKAGSTVVFTWYWEVLKPVNKNWKAFVHLDGAGGKFRQNLDHVPVENMYQTSQWKVGEIIRDKQSVRLKNDLPNGTISTFLGFYRGNQRMAISNAVKKTKEASPRVIGPKIQVSYSKKSKNPKPSYRLHFDADFSEAMTIDGHRKEKIWKTIRPLQLKALGAAPNLRNDVYAFASKDYLYISAHLQDEHIWGTLKNRDDETWKEEVLEMFLDFDGDGSDYLELQITPLNTIFDANFKKTLSGKNRNAQIEKAKAFNLLDFKSAVSVDGTLNDDEKDKSWSVELKIPLASIPGFSPAVLKNNAKWAINFYRFDRPEKGKSFAYAWSTEPAGNFHQVSKFGAFAVSEPIITNKIAPHILDKMKNQRIRDLRKNMLNTKALKIPKLEEQPKK